jgi:hypothetical protein
MALKRTNGKFEGAGRFKEVVFGGTEEVLKKYANKLSPAVFSLGQKDLERLINDPDADMGGISEDEKAFSES